MNRIQPRHNRTPQVAIARRILADGTATHSERLLAAHILELDEQVAGLWNEVIAAHQKVTEEKRAHEARLGAMRAEFDDRVSERVSELVDSHVREIAEVL